MRNKEKIVALLNEIEELSETLSKQDTTPTKRLLVGHDLDNCLLLLARYSIRDIADQCGVTLVHYHDDEVVVFDDLTSHHITSFHIKNNNRAILRDRLFFTSSSLHTST
jgi:hypothetical protein